MPRKVVTQKEAAPVYKCLCCGCTKKETEFYRSPYSKTWKQSNQRVLFCKNCLEQLFHDESEQYGVETAFVIALARLDLPYYRNLYVSMVEKYGACNIGSYARLMNGTQYRDVSWVNTIVDGELERTINEVREQREGRWGKSDKNNMYAVISMVGYDPFADLGLTENDRKYCFNVMAGYCAIPGIDEDGHKLESAVQITLSRLQCKQIDDMIFKESSLKNPNIKTLDTLSATKKGLLDTINRIAKDNNLSSAYNSSSSPGQNTLSKKMKELAADDFKAIQVNVFDIQTCAAMKQIADLSNQSILEQLSLESSDYIEMIKEQREMLGKITAERDELKEENRNLKNKLNDSGGDM